VVHEYSRETDWVVLVAYHLPAWSLDEDHKQLGVALLNLEVSHFETKNLNFHFASKA
jgi:hypothetical protein